MDNSGVVYIVFGEKARVSAEHSISTLRQFNPELPVMVVGDEQAERILQAGHIPWTGESPYNSKMPTQFHFLAGRVKPFLYDLSPFDKTLYVDADTEFQASPLPGFKLLDRYDFMLAKHASHNIGMLNQMPGQERLQTIAELGDGDIPYPNSGVFFWRRSPAVETLFHSWYDEWMRYQGWDEQLALLRALYHNPLKLLLLPEAWNGENKKEGSIIFHDFHGARIARSNTPILERLKETVETDV